MRPKKYAIPDDTDWIIYNLHPDSTLPLFRCNRRKPKEILQHMKYCLPLLLQLEIDYVYSHEATISKAQVFHVKACEWFYI